MTQQLKFKEIQKYLNLKENSKVAAFKDKEVYLFLGNIGAGKSTLIAYLMRRYKLKTSLGFKPTVNYVNDGGVIIDPPSGAPKIGQKGNAETSCPEIYSVPYVENSVQKNYFLSDCSGFHDNRTDEEVVCVSINFEMAIRRANENIKGIVIVIEASSFTESRGASLKNLSKTLSHLIKNHQALENSICFVITKMGRDQLRDSSGFENVLSDIIQNVEENIKKQGEKPKEEDINERYILELIKNQVHKKRCFFLNIESYNSREDILKCLDELQNFSSKLFNFDNYDPLRLVFKNTVIDEASVANQELSDFFAILSDINSVKQKLEALNQSRSVSQQLNQVIENIENKSDLSQANANKAIQWLEKTSIRIQQEIEGFKLQNEGEFNKCDLLYTSCSPEKLALEDIEKLPGKCAFSYIFNENKLYYLNKKNACVEVIKIDENNFKKLVNNLKVEQQLVAKEFSKCLKEDLSAEDLNYINSITGHNYKSLKKQIFDLTQRKNTLESDVEVECFKKENTFANRSLLSWMRGIDCEKIEYIDKRSVPIKRIVKDQTHGEFRNELSQLNIGSYSVEFRSYFTYFTNAKPSYCIRGIISAKNLHENIEELKNIKSNLENKIIESNRLVQVIKEKDDALFAITQTLSTIKKGSLQQLISQAGELRIQLNDTARKIEELTKQNETLKTNYAAIKNKITPEKIEICEIILDICATINMNFELAKLLAINIKRFHHLDSSNKQSEDMLVSNINDNNSSPPITLTLMSELSNEITSLYQQLTIKEERIKQLEEALLEKANTFKAIEQPLASRTNKKVPNKDNTVKNEKLHLTAVKQKEKAPKNPITSFVKFSNQIIKSKQYTDFTSIMIKVIQESIPLIRKSNLLEKIPSLPQELKRLEDTLFISTVARPELLIQGNQIPNIGMMHKAILSGKINLVKNCISSGFRWEEVNEEEKNIFHLFCPDTTVKSSLITEIIELVPNKELLFTLFRAKDKDNYTPLMYVVKANREVTLKEIAKYCLELFDSSLIYQACSNLSFKSLKVINSLNKTLLWEPSAHGNYSLHLAIQSGFPAKELAIFEESSKNNLSYRSCWDLKNNQGQQPLHIAVQYNQQSLFLQLIEYGAKLTPDTVDNQGYTPLHMLCQVAHGNQFTQFLSNHGKMFETLLQLSHCRDNQGKLAIHYAAKHGLLRLVEIFIKRGIDINAIDNSGWSPLQYAVFTGKIEIVKFFTNFEQYPNLNIYARDVTNKNIFMLHKERKNKEPDSWDLIAQFLNEFRKNNSIKLIIEYFKVKCLVLDGKKLKTLYETLKKKILLSDITMKDGAKLSHKLLEVVQYFLENNIILTNQLNSLEETETPDTIIDNVANVLAETFSRLYKENKKELKKYLENFPKEPSLVFSSAIEKAINEVAQNSALLSNKKSKLSPLEAIRECLGGFNNTIVQNEPTSFITFRQTMTQLLHGSFYVSDQIRQGLLTKPQATYDDIIQFAQAALPLITSGIGAISNAFVPQPIANAIGQSGNFISLALPLISTWSKNRQLESIKNEYNQILTALGVKQHADGSQFYYKLKEEAIKEVSCGLLVRYALIIEELTPTDAGCLAFVAHQCIIQHIAAGETQYEEDIGKGLSHGLTRIRLALARMAVGQPGPMRLDLFERCMVAIIKEKLNEEYFITWRGKQIKAMDILQYCTFTISEDQEIQYFVHPNHIDNPRQFGICLGFQEIDRKLRNSYICIKELDYDEVQSTNSSKTKALESKQNKVHPCSANFFKQQGAQSAHNSTSIQLLTQQAQKIVNADNTVSVILSDQLTAKQFHRKLALSLDLHSNPKSIYYNPGIETNDDSYVITLTQKEYMQLMGEEAWEILTRVPTTTLHS